MECIFFLRGCGRGAGGVKRSFYVKFWLHSFQFLSKIFLRYVCANLQKVLIPTANPLFFYLRTLLLQKSGKHNLNYFFAKCWAFLNDNINLHYLQLSKKLIIIIYIIYNYQRYYRNACQSALWYFCGCNNIWLSINYCLINS
jgi:hypothetical protein